MLYQFLHVVTMLPSIVGAFCQLKPVSSAVSNRRISGSSLTESATNKLEPSVHVVKEFPPPIPPLKNNFYLLRHGQSTANLAGIISSARILATTTNHGLTLLGIEQARNSAVQLIDRISNDLNAEEALTPSTKQVYFYSSPFARARETAEQCIKGLQNNDEVRVKVESLGLNVNEQIQLHDGLMERYFGRLDGKELATYAYVWPVDMFLNTHTAFDVESVAAVSSRMRQCLLDIDSHHAEGGNHIVLASHADVLQITQVYAAGLDNVGMFSQYRFGNGEIRTMKRSVDSLPKPQPLQPPKRGEFAT